jgi:seryl-tRNA synthetase
VFTDYQARRAGIRFRESQAEKPRFVHTLNGSGVALPRLMVALLETYQQADGSVRFPEAIQPFVGMSEIRP